MKPIVKLEGVVVLTAWVSMGEWPELVKQRVEYQIWPRSTWIYQDFLNILKYF